jgi:acetylornithine aminotransferase
MLELVIAEGGVLPATNEFVQEIVKLCKAHNLLLIVDEVQTGLGRTGKLFAYEHYGIEPDIFTLAKALGSGFPIGAMLGKAKLIEAFTAGSHGSTFGGTPIATAAAIATVETIIGQQLPERVAELGTYTLNKLGEALKGNPLVKEIRGKGLLIGIECKQPVAELVTAIHQNGLLVLTAGPNVIRLLPNFLITQDDLDRGIALLCSVLAEHAAAVVKG